jgi:hypothetical protein
MTGLRDDRQIRSSWGSCRWPRSLSPRTLTATTPTSWNCSSRAPQSVRSSVALSGFTSDGAGGSASRKCLKAPVFPSARSKQHDCQFPCPSPPATRVRTSRADRCRNQGHVRDAAVLRASRSCSQGHAQGGVAMTTLIELPFPPASLSGTTKATGTPRARLSQSIASGRAWQPWRLLSGRSRARRHSHQLHVLPARPARMTDNLSHRIKAYADGIADALKVNDKRSCQPSTSPSLARSGRSQS